MMTRFVELCAVVLLVVTLAAPENSGCGCYGDTIDVRITTQPEGGESVGTLTCEFTAKYMYDESDGEDEVKLEAIWMNENGEHRSETFTLTRDADVQELSTTMSAPAGLYLDKTFWVEFDSMLDIDGANASDKATCTVP